MKKPTAFGKYFLLERINVGGMAEVFRAKAFGVEGFERLVAVKRILPNIAEDKEFIRMFIEEAKLSVQLNHANIAQIFDLGVVDGSYYIALEHVHGRDLRGIFDRGRQLGEVMPVAQACFIAMKVCEGLDYAHNKRDQSGRELSLVHRDVSPQNILVSFEGEVKLIDFGIAKAAGTGAKTQAGILKGKFGYMSPEQVRGLSVDRRSDVFSCGIVLYELLTGERLFVGESDFSTLEKVRNVEILPPSTYNRKIPDELERIVLKALTKDVDDRYQNAIDLHDELQAFVYTAGEFYSRKDLAGWMKKTFGKEIEEETAKLESYRQLRPPVPLVTSVPSAAPVAVPPAASGPVSVPAAAPSAPVAVLASVPLTGPIAAPGAVPPPSLAAVSAAPPAPSPSLPQQLPLAPPPPTPDPSQVPALAGGGPRPGSASKPPPRKPTQQVPVTRPPPPPSVSRSQPVAAVAAPMAASAASGPVAQRAERGPGRGQLNPHELDWNDDEIETRIYEDDEQRRRAKRPTNLPLQPPVVSSPGISITADEPPPNLDGPDLSALAPAPGAWDRSGASPSQFPSGSNNVPSPYPPEPMFDPRAHSAATPVPVRREFSGSHRVASDAVPEALFDPMASFGVRITGGRRTDQRSVAAIVLGGATLVALVVIAVMLVFGGSKPAPAPPPAPVKSPAVVAADPNTGFDLYVTPPGMTQWKLDGESRTDRLPSRVRGIAAGTHTVQIEPPPGFMSQFQKVTVEPGHAPKVEIVLQPIPGIVGVFESNPPGANVSLITDGKRQPIGPSPAKAPLDPRSTYQVLFERPGYVSVNRPVSFSGGLEERVAVNLERADPPAPPPPPASSAESRPAPAPAQPPPAPAPAQPRKPSHPEKAPERAPDKAPELAADAAAERTDAAPEPRPGADAKGQGVLVLGSKPPCDIYIDGAATGLHTPQKEIKLPVGRHRVTLMNNEFAIKESFTVDIKADAPEKVIKDYSDRLPN